MNVLFDSNDVPTIADFGMSYVLDLSTPNFSRPGSGTPRWQAPEIMSQEDTVPKKAASRGIYLSACRARRVCHFISKGITKEN